jgi:hypothetical protein
MANGNLFSQLQVWSHFVLGLFGLCASAKLRRIGTGADETSLSGFFNHTFISVISSLNKYLLEVVLAVERVNGTYTQ